MSGSGDAAAVAFNKAVTVNTAQFGLSPMNMGSVAAIICAILVGAHTLEILKRNGAGTLITVMVCMAMLLYP